MHFSPWDSARFLAALVAGVIPSLIPVFFFCAGTIKKDTMQQQTITTYGPLADHIQRLADEYPGITAHRVGRALLTLAIRQVEAAPDLLAEELRALTSRREEGQSGA